MCVAELRWSLFQFSFSELLMDQSSFQPFFRRPFSIEFHSLICLSFNSVHSYSPIRWNPFSTQPLSNSSFPGGVSSFLSRLNRKIEGLNIERLLSWLNSKWSVFLCPCLQVPCPSQHYLFSHLLLQWFCFPASPFNCQQLSAHQLHLFSIRSCAI